MSKHNDYKSIDELIKHSLHDKAKKDKNIDIEDAWEKFNNKYYPVKKKLYRKIAAVACSIFILLFTSITFLPNEVTAVNSKVFDNIKRFLAGKVQSNEVSFTEKEKESTLNQLEPEVKRALMGSGYDVLLPIGLSDKYSIDDVTVQKNGKRQEIELLLTTADNRTTIVREVNVIDGIKQGISYDTDDAIMKNINIRGQKATLVINQKHKMTMLSWVDRDIFISIMGSLTEDEIIELASYLTRVNIN
ncbi:DUF4367 domain-containing protein [Peptococcaceae bacterium 1198_IL3148]